MEMNKIFQGDCVDVLQAFPDNSIDLVVTDPPYGLSFMGKDWDKALPSREAFEGIIRVLKPGALAFVMSSPRQDVLWRMLSMLEGVGFELTQSYIDWIYKTGFPKAYDVSKGIDKKLGLKREIVGKHNQTIPQISPRINFGERYGDEESSRQLITEPASDLAKKWDGWKSQTGLKPAHEPILMVNKPFSESTIVDTVLKWGTGAINVDACRIPFEAGESAKDLGRSSQGFTAKSETYHNDPKYEISSEAGHSKGRFPANLLVSDKAIDTGEKTGAGVTGSGVVTQKNRGEWLPHNVYGERKVIHENIPYMDVGDQSRYFDLDAWAEHHGFLDVPKPSKAERDFGLKGFPLKNQRKQDGSWGSHEIFEIEGSGRKTGTLNRNYHPTVKPVKLMAYLIELGCPSDGVVLDPFMGSGTTCIAAKKLVRKYIGIEINPEYFEIAKARIAAYPNPLSWFE